MKKYIFLLFVPTFCFVFEYLPWFGSVYEFNFNTKYCYSTFSSFDSAKVPISHSSNNNCVELGLDFTLPKTFFAAEIDFISTYKQPFSFSSCAIQAKYLCLDDIVGDFATLTVGADLRVVAYRSVKDIASYYSGEVESIFHLSLGKEFSQLEFWVLRAFATGGLGVANRGSPFLMGIFGVEGNHRDLYTYGVHLTTIHGYGNKTVVDIERFRGYGYIRDKSIDLAFFIRYSLGVYGELKAEYQKRVYAKRAPKNVDSFCVTYKLPFSF